MAAFSLLDIPIKGYLTSLGNIATADIAKAIAIQALAPVSHFELFKKALLTANRASHLTFIAPVYESLKSW